MQLAYIGLEVSDLSAWRDFGINILGLMQANEDDDSGSLIFRNDECTGRIILSEGASDDLSFVGFALPTPASLSELRARLDSAGFEVNVLSSTELANRPLMSGFYCVDPFGHRFEFGCGLTIEMVKPFASSTGARFVSGDLGFGHVVLSAPDESKGKPFYEEILGFRLSDHINLSELGEDIMATFYHCNPRHHTLATLNIEQPKKLQHFMLELESIDDVGRAYDRCMDQGVPLATTMGKHTNDRMTSFYVCSPSGFAVEVGCGGRLVDDETWFVEYYEKASFWGHRVVVPDFVKE